jgi:hypothetical protein
MVLILFDIKYFDALNSISFTSNNTLVVIFTSSRIVFWNEIYVMNFFVFFVWNIVAIYLFGFLTRILWNGIYNQFSFKNS